MSSILCKSIVLLAVCTAASGVAALPTQKRALPPVRIPLEDFFLGTDLLWFGNISVGTPPQNISVVFDTASTGNLMIASNDCLTCTQPNLYNSSKSATYQSFPISLEIELDPGFGVAPVQPGDYVVVLAGALDTLSVGDIMLPVTSFFTIADQTQKFNADPFVGIFDLSAVPGTPVRQMIQQGMEPVFSTLLTPKAVGNAELLLGGIDNTKFKVDLVFANQTADNGFWTLDATAIAVNGQSTSLLTSVRPIVFDSSAPNVLLSIPVTEAIYALISPDIQPFAAEPGAYGIACSAIADLPAVIDITFTAQPSGDPFNLTIPSSELSVGPFASDPSTCQTLINAADDTEIIGGSLLKHYYTVWDIGNQQMGFAPNGF